MKQIYTYGRWVLIVFAFIILIYFVSETKAKNNNLEVLLEDNLEQNELVQNKNQTLIKSIKTLETENKDLQSLIADLRARPDTIRYITKTETVLRPSEPIFITPDLPDEYLFKVEESLVVGRFAKQEAQYEFSTYDLSFRNILVVAENKTNASLQVSSSYDNQWREVPIEVQVSKINKQKLIEPHIGVGVSGSLPSPNLQASVFLSAIHPRADIDLGLVRASANKNTVSFGFDPVAYNLGAQLPIITDLWITAGPSIDTSGRIQGTVTLGSKF